jgi:hypothetical protein
LLIFWLRPTAYTASSSSYSSLFIAGLES